MDRSDEATSEAVQTVWLVESGMYDSHAVDGIYATLEGAKAASGDSRTRWREDGHGGWVNGEDWGGHVSIRPMDVEA